MVQNEMWICCNILSTNCVDEDQVCFLITGYERNYCSKDALLSQVCLAEVATTLEFVFQ